MKNGTTTPTEDDYRGEEMPTWAVAVFSSLHTLTSVNGAVGSVLILTALTGHKHFLNASCTYTAYMANLVVTDIYFQIYFFPMLAAGLALRRYPVVDETHCLLTGYAAMTCYSVFLLTLAAISFDRYVRVCHDAIHRRYFSRKTSLCACAGIWFLGCLTPIPAAVNNSLGFDTKTWVCFTKPSADSSVSMPYLLCFCVSLLSSGFFNCRIYQVYHSSRRRVVQHGTNMSGDRRVSSEDSVNPTQKTVTSSDMALLRSLLVIFLCLVLFVTPGSLARGLRSRLDIPNVLYAFFLWLLSLNSSIDWIVYGLLNTRFRQGYRSCLARWGLCVCGSNTESQTTSVV